MANDIVEELYEEGGLKKYACDRFGSIDNFYVNLSDGKIIEELPTKLQHNTVIILRCYKTYKEAIAYATEEQLCDVDFLAEVIKDFPELIKNAKFSYALYALLRICPEAVVYVDKPIDDIPLAIQIFDTMHTMLPVISTEYLLSNRVYVSHVVSYYADADNKSYADDVKLVIEKARKDTLVGNSAVQKLASWYPEIADIGAKRNIPDIIFKTAAFVNPDYISTEILSDKFEVIKLFELMIKEGAPNAHIRRLFERIPKKVYDELKKTKTFTGVNAALHH